jgi:hypothetical protein
MGETVGWALWQLAWQYGQRLRQTQQRLGCLCQLLREDAVQRPMFVTRDYTAG